MDVRLVIPALLAAGAGALLTFGVYGVIEVAGPAERREATVETRSYEQGRSSDRIYHLVLRTGSGERFEARGTDKNLDLEPGLPVLLEVSEVGRAVQTVEAGGHRAANGSLDGLAFVAGAFGFMMLLWALGSTDEMERLGPAALSATAGLGTGALLAVWLLF